MENKRSLINRELENLIEKDLIGISKSIKSVLDMALKAAKQLGIPNDALFRCIKKYKIQIEKNFN